MTCPFTVSAGQEITADLTNLPDDYDLSLYNPAFTPVEGSHHRGATPEHLVHTAAMSGDYRVAVVGWSSGNFDPVTPYTLLVQLDVFKVYVPLILKQ